MATIDREQLVTDVNFWLPPANTLTNTEILTVGELVITQVGDDSSKYAEVLCKTLRACAVKNLTIAVTSAGAKKRQRIGDNETEYFNGSVKASWQDYIDSLADICPLFGYTPSVAIGIYINPGDAIDVFEGAFEDTDEDAYL